MPIKNYSRDKLVDSDVQEGWKRIEPDIIPDHGPFTDTQDLNMSTNSCEPEDFFKHIFDDRMFTMMAEETKNNIAWKPNSWLYIIMQHRTDVILIRTKILLHHISYLFNYHISY